MMLNFQQKLRARRQAKADGLDLKDAGFTLPELLVAVVLSGLLVSVIATAISVMLRSTPDAADRLAESKDITFLQTFIPVDLATAINSYDSPDDAVVLGLLAANPPNVVYSNNPDGTSLLPGTNVLTLVVPNADNGQLEIISYRYIEPRPGDWQLARFRIENPGQASQTVSPVGVAHEIPAPPPGWSEGDPVDHAFEVTARNQVVLRPIGEDITVTFESGNQFRTGGAGLSAEQDLTPNDPVTLPDPTAPPTRCGGRVALVLDTSWSVPDFGGGADLESAATGFIDAFIGTPTQVTVMGFDGMAYSLYPNLNGTRGEYFSLLDPSVDSNGDGTTDLDNAKTNIQALPNVDGSGGSYWVPTGTGIGDGSTVVGWSKQRTSETGGFTIQGYTNWEDALHAPFFDQSGVLRPQTPEMVVWITDGDPNIDRDGAFQSSPSGVSTTDGVNAAATAANAGRSTGARIIGVFVGGDNPSLEANLATVVGGNKWTGTGPLDLGNAVAADYFTGGFADLGGVLRSIIAAQCGGTVTVRKTLDGGGDPGGQWTYATETGNQVLDLAVSSSITFDFAFETGVISRVVTIREEVVDGFSFVRGDCTVGGNPVDPSDIEQQPDGIPGVALTIGPDQAVSCVMVSAAE